MKINSVQNNCSFKALMLERKPITRNQKILIKNIASSILDKDCYINLLENKNTDIYISANSDGKTVDLKLLTAAGLTYNFIPKDDKGELKVNIHVPEQLLNDDYVAEQRLAGNIELRTKKFLKRAVNCVSNYLHHPMNVSKLDYYDAASMSDLAAKEIQLPDIVPNAKVLYGSPAVSTKSKI